MEMEFPLSDFCIIKLSFFDSDFNDANSSIVKFKAALFLLYELNDESPITLILAFRSRFFWSVTSRFCMSRLMDDMRVDHSDVTASARK